MHKFPFIRQFLAAVLLLFFAFSITPKLTLHNLVANHKEGRSSKANTDLKHQQLSRSGINCLCDNLVAESPFVSEEGCFEKTAPFLFLTHQDKLVPFHAFSSLFSYGLRGPPVV